MVDSIKLKGIIIWLTCAVFYLYEFLLRTVIGAFQIPMMDELGLSTFEFSMVSATAFLLVYGLMQIPVGIIIDFCGLKKSMSVACLLCTVSAIGVANSDQFISVLVFRMLMGLGASFGFIGLLIAVNEWLPSKNRALYIGMSQFIGVMGAMLSAGPIESIAHSGGLSWRDIFIYLGAFGFILFVLIVFVVENNNEEMSCYKILKRPVKTNLLIRRLFLRSQPWFIAIFSSGVYFAVEYLSENEGRIFLNLKGVDSITSSYIITLSWLGFAVGCPVIGFISDYLQRRKILIIVASIIGLTSMLGVMYTQSPQMLAVYFFFLGVSCSGQSIGFVMISEQFKKQFIAAGFGMNNAVILLISSFNAPLIAYVLDSNMQGDALSVSDYTNAYMIIVGLLATSLVISIFFIKETYCKSAVDYTYLK